MRRPGPRSQSRGMNANTMNQEAPTTEPTDSRPEPRPGFDPERTALRRPFEDRMLAGGAAGPARYFCAHTTNLPIAFLVLTLCCGAGNPLSPARPLLIPHQGSHPANARPLI